VPTFDPTNWKIRLPITGINLGMAAN
jgi:hypothetical protein